MQPVFVEWLCITEERILFVLSIRPNMVVDLDIKRSPLLRIVRDFKVFFIDICAVKRPGNRVAVSIIGSTRDGIAVHPTASMDEEGQRMGIRVVMKGVCDIKALILVEEEVGVDGVIKGFVTHALDGCSVWVTEIVSKIGNRHRAS